MSFVAVGIGGAALMIGGGAMGAGKKVKIPDYQRVDIEGEQKGAIQQNLKSLPQGAELASKTAQADQDTLTAILRRAIPGYDRIIEQQSNIVQQQMRGELPSDVSASVLRSGAARALGTGMRGSQLGRNLTLRDLGLTSMGVQQQGLNNAMTFIQNQRSTGMVNPMSAASMFVSPQQRMAIKERENAALFQRNLMAAQVKAQPDPMMAALGSSFSNIGGMMLGGAISGGMSPGGGNKSSGQSQPMFQFSMNPQMGYFPGMQYQMAGNPTPPPTLYANVPGGSGNIPLTGNYFGGF